MNRGPFGAGGYTDGGLMPLRGSGVGQTDGTPPATLTGPDGAPISVPAGDQQRARQLQQAVEHRRQRAAAAAAASAEAAALSGGAAAGGSVGRPSRVRATRAAAPAPAPAPAAAALVTHEVTFVQDAEEPIQYPIYDTQEFMEQGKGLAASVTHTVATAAMARMTLPLLDAAARPVAAASWPPAAGAPSPDQDLFARARVRITDPATGRVAGVEGVTMVFDAAAGVWCLDAAEW